MANHTTPISSLASISTITPEPIETEQKSFSHSIDLIKPSPTHLEEMHTLLLREGVAFVTIDQLEMILIGFNFFCNKSVIITHPGLALIKEQLSLFFVGRTIAETMNIEDKSLPTERQLEFLRELEKKRTFLKTIIKQTKIVQTMISSSFGGNREAFLFNPY